MRACRGWIATAGLFARAHQVGAVSVCLLLAARLAPAHSLHNHRPAHALLLCNMPTLADSGSAPFSELGVAAVAAEQEARLQRSAPQQQQQQQQQQRSPAAAAGRAIQGPGRKGPWGGRAPSAAGGRSSPAGTSGSPAGRQAGAARSRAGSDPSGLRWGRTKPRSTIILVAGSLQAQSSLSAGRSPVAGERRLDDPARRGAWLLALATGCEPCAPRPAACRAAPPLPPFAAPQGAAGGASRTRGRLPQRPSRRQLATTTTRTTAGTAVRLAARAAWPAGTRASRLHPRR